MAIRFIYNEKYNSHNTPMFKNLHLLHAVDIFKLACFNFFSSKCENRIIPDYFKNMFLIHGKERVAIMKLYMSLFCELLILLNNNELLL